MPEKKERVDLPPGYDPEAEPVDFTDPQKVRTGGMVMKLKRLARYKAQAASVKKQMDELQASIIPELRAPVLFITGGKRVIAAAAQAKPITVDAGELRQALLDYGFDDDEVDTKMGDVLKPPEVDTKENGKLEQAVKDGTIPLEVFAKVAREKPSSAYIKFG